MKKKFKLQDLDCAHCAAKMEEAIKKIPGVNDASVSFMTQKMTILMRSCRRLSVPVPRLSLTAGYSSS